MKGHGTPILSENQYQYNGKELNADFGLDLYDYGARCLPRNLGGYDASVGRWHGVDPLAEAFSVHSPYNYGVNNPIMMVDPDGRSAEPPHKRHISTASMIAKRTGTKNTTISLARVSEITFYNEEGKKVITRSESRQYLETNDKGDVKSFSSVWTEDTSIDGEVQPDKSTSGYSNDFETSGDGQLKKAKRVIEGIYEEGMKAGPDMEEPTLNIVGMSNNPVGETSVAETGVKSILTATAGKLAKHPAASIALAMLMTASSDKDGEFDFSNTAVLLDDFADTGSEKITRGNEYGSKSEYQVHKPIIREDGALHNDKINKYDTRNKE
jgi:RHS repeat-associated protein